MAIAFLCSALGQLPQPDAGLSVLWPANALLAGLLIRHPALGHSLSWAGALGGLTLANFFLEGLRWPAALGYAVTDLSGVLVAWIILSPNRRAPARLRSPRAIGQVLAACATAAATNAAVALILTPWLRPDTQWVTVALNWFFGQMLSYSAFLPPIMLLPRRPGLRGDRRHSWTSLLRRMGSGTLLLPFAALIASLFLCFLLGGPGAAAFPIPALMYCALAYRQSTTAWITLLTALAVLLGIANGWLSMGEGQPLAGRHAWDMVSLRLGVLLLVMSPLLVSGILAARSDLISSLNLALDHDGLTRALSRQAFLRSADEHFGRTPAPPRGNALLMLDIDHFKRLNDQHGHAAGDQVLKDFARTIRTIVRPHDLFGRLGGEEFALFLPDTSERDANDIAERLRFCVERLEVFPGDGPPLRISVSIGTVHDSRTPLASLSELLAYADRAMYQAKRSGRNRVHAHSGHDGQAPDAKEDPAWHPPLNNAPRAP
ncbi:GGDEF domain-containing protein [Castellaniella sp. WN]